MSKRILYQTDHELLALEVKTGIRQTQIKDEVEFNNYLANDPKTPIYWLVDTVKEEYKMTILPHVLGKDRNDLIRHRKKRLFKENTYSNAVVQDREKKGRKDDLVLFTALTDPEFLQPWLKVILTHKVPLVGIYSVPLLSQKLLDLLPKSNYTLLITDNSPTAINPGSIRQSFFRNQKLQFSRLIPLHIKNPQEYANYVIKQITTTQHYLENNRLLPETETLTIIILTNTDKCKVCAAINSSTVNLNITFVDTKSIKLNMHNSELSLQNFVTTLFAKNWLVKNHYAKTNDRTYLLHRRGRFVMYLLSVLILAGTMTVGSFIVQDALKLKHKGQDFLDKANNLQIKLQKLRENEFPNLPFKSELIVSIVDVGLRLQAKHISPRDTWEQLSNVLNLHHQLILTKLEWEVANSPNEIFKSESKTETNFQPKKQFVEGVRIHGNIIDFKNYKDSIYLFKKFIKDLSKYWKVKVIQNPYELNRKLQGNSEIPKAPFIIEILIYHIYPHESD